MLTYKLKHKESCFEDFYSLLVMIDCLATATQWHTTAKIDFKYGDTVALECKHLSKEVHLPIFGPVKSALAGSTPYLIEVSIKSLNQTPPSYKTKISGFAVALEKIFQPFFVNYYERNLDQIKKKFGEIDKDAPSVWQMSWVVRNAMAHNGCIYFRNQNHPPISWQGLVVSPADNGKKMFNEILSAADLIIMMLEMEESIAGEKIDKAYA